MRDTAHRLVVATGVSLLALGCGTGPNPTAPTPVTPNSFLAGTWSGGVTIQTVDAGAGSSPVAPGTGAMTCTFTDGAFSGVFRVTCRITHPGLTITSQQAEGSMNSTTPPTALQVLTDYVSQHGCPATFLLSLDAPSRTRLDGAIRGIDCGFTYRGLVNLQKQ